MPSLPLVAESHKFSMIFLLSSGCCSSLRWKKGEEEKGQGEGEEVKRGNQVQETTTTWMAMMMVVSGVRTRLELEPM